MAFLLDNWADSIVGHWLDLDYAPAGQPYQCHDVWLSRLYALGGKAGDGHAPGTGFTHETWRAFPGYRPRLSMLFTKHVGNQSIRRGDIIFWHSYQGGLAHVAVALEDATGGRVLCVTQNPGRVRREVLDISTGVDGVLRPKDTESNGPGKAPELKPIAEVAAEVRNGDWGDGAVREQRLTAAGYSYPAVQAEVNRQIAGTKTPLLPLAEIAAEVIRGNKWGNGRERQQRLTTAGYDYPTVQAEVNRQLAQAASRRTHTVQRGESLSTIATRYGTNWQAIYNANRNIIGNNPSIIYAGTQLVIP